MESKAKCSENILTRHLLTQKKLHGNSENILRHPLTQKKLHANIIRWKRVRQVQEPAKDRVQATLSRYDDAAFCVGRDLPCATIHGAARVRIRSGGTRGAAEALTSLQSGAKRVGKEPEGHPVITASRTPMRALGWVPRLAES